MNELVKSIEKSGKHLIYAREAINSEIQKNLGQKASEKLLAILESKHDGKLNAAQWTAVIIESIAETVRDTFFLRLGVMPPKSTAKLFKAEDKVYIDIPYFEDELHTYGLILFICNSVSSILLINNTLYIDYQVLSEMDKKFIEEFKAITANTKPTTKVSKKTYLMKDGNGYTKIGRAANPSIRESTLQSENPSITLLATCDENIETLLHNEFAIYHQRGEWYNLSDEQIAHIIKEYNFKLSKWYK